MVAPYVPPPSYEVVDDNYRAWFVMQSRSDEYTLFLEYKAGPGVWRPICFIPKRDKPPKPAWYGTKVYCCADADKAMALGGAEVLRYLNTNRIGPQLTSEQAEDMLRFTGIGSELPDRLGAYMAFGRYHAFSRPVRFNKTLTAVHMDPDRVANAD